MTYENITTLDEVFALGTVSAAMTFEDTNSTTKEESSVKTESITTGDE